MYYILRLLNRALAGLFGFVLEQIATIIRGVSAGVADTLRELAPWALAGLAIVLIVEYDPEAARGIVSLMLFLAIMKWGASTLLPQKKRRRRR